MKVIMDGLEKFGVLVGNDEHFEICRKLKWKVHKCLTSTGLFKKELRRNKQEDPDVALWKSLGVKTNQGISTNLVPFRVHAGR